MDYFSSDFHIGHTMAMLGDNAPFATIDEHDEAVFDRVNTMVGPRDRLFFLGDMTLRDGREFLVKTMSRFRAPMHIIWGNHDDGLRKLVERHPELFPNVKSAQDVLYLRVNKQKIFLSHYAHRSWRSQQHGSWHLFGHSHGKLDKKPYGKSLDVGLNSHSYHPISFDQVAAMMASRDVESPDHAVRMVPTFTATGAQIGEALVRFLDGYPETDEATWVHADDAIRDVFLWLLEARPELDEIDRSQVSTPRLWNTLHKQAIRQGWYLLAPGQKMQFGNRFGIWLGLKTEEQE